LRAFTWLRECQVFLGLTASQASLCSFAGCIVPGRRPLSNFIVSNLIASASTALTVADRAVGRERMEPRF
jgi:hypothetical protein